MENDFEKYIDDNRGKLEKGAPPPEIWQRLKEQLIEHHNEKPGAAKPWMKWVVAASLLLLAGAASLLFITRQARTTTLGVSQGQQTAATNTTRRSDSSVTENYAAIDTPIEKAHPVEVDYSQSIVNYQAAVKTKEKQIIVLQKTDPELYKDFKKAIDDLDEIVADLQARVPGSIDKERILRSIIENLQMQETILNSQLQVLKNIQPPNNHAGKKTYDEI